MHHLILLLPLFGIVVFWLLPLSSAIPVYIGIFVASGLMYWAILRAIRKIPTTGAAGLVGTSAKVVSSLSPSEEAQYLVEAQGELWSANSPDTLRIGETVTITGMKGVRLEVARTAAPAAEGHKSS